MQRCLLGFGVLSGYLIVTASWKWVRLGREMVEEDQTATVCGGWRFIPTMTMRLVVDMESRVFTVTDMDIVSRVADRIS